jgi:hypothetical protein
MKSVSTTLLTATAGVAAIIVAATTVSAAITFPVSIKDTAGGNDAYYDRIRACVQAAGAEWARYLTGSGSIEVEVEITLSAFGVDGQSLATGFVRRSGDRDILEQGAAYELRTGIDPNGATPDVRIRIYPSYLQPGDFNLWFDPDPTTRTAAVPPLMQDAISVFTHELGHAFVFNGWMNPTTGELPPSYMSTYDENVQFDGSNFFFVGANAQASYGGPVPLEDHYPFHLDHHGVADLMALIDLGTRSRISTLDLAISKDCGLLLLSPSKLLNISTRLNVGKDDNVLIGGFIISGTGTKQVLVRGLGPTLTDFGVPGAVVDPTLELHQSDAQGRDVLLATNDNWKQTQQAAIQTTGKAPPKDAEAAILRTLAPGKYTAILRGKNNTTGVGLAEVYDISQDTASKLSNISSRGLVGTGGNVMIGGFIAGANTKVIVRALGPTLTQFGVQGALVDPVLALADANGNIIASNDNWQSTQAAQIQAAGYAPPNAAEAAIIATPAAGNSTAIVNGKNGTTGVALLEVYQLP